MRGELVNLYATSELHSIESALWARELPGKKITNYSRAPLMGPPLFVGSVFVFSFRVMKALFGSAPCGRGLLGSPESEGHLFRTLLFPQLFTNPRPLCSKGWEKKKGVEKRERDRQKKVEWTKVLSSHMKLVYQPPPLALHKTHTHTLLHFTGNHGYRNVFSD